MTDQPTSSSDQPTEPRPPVSPEEKPDESQVQSSSAQPQSPRDGAEAELAAGEETRAVEVSDSTLNVNIDEAESEKPGAAVPEEPGAGEGSGSTLTFRHPTGEPDQTGGWYSIGETPVDPPSS
ncbi:MAG TPA: hypothetical protein VHO48_03470, partial [Anaerolineaceae bacterium]|nr:hypothetical protein [Anaerolineaceae bacterium]